MTKFRILHSIADISRNRWDRCANPDHGESYNPFVSYDFLAALEDSNSVNTRSGWRSHHVELVGDDGEPLGVAPMYLKQHSQGEYVFDHGWAHALQRAGRSYYPKLQISVPFTPITGRRLLTHLTGAAGERAERLLAACCVSVTQKHRLSSAHITFMPESQWHLVGEQGWLLRMDRQYHWFNKGYGNFADFLAELPSRKRKNCKRERREALAAGIRVEWLRGKDVQEHHWDEFYRFYTDTGARKWGAPYLTRAFFSLVGASMGDHILLILCRRDRRYMAGALNFIGGDTLYGRNWGCTENHRFLHFETCYYQAIDFAIQHGLRRVEAGAQGQHKLARGYLPRPTFSAHWIADQDFRAAIAHFLEHERQEVCSEIAYAAGLTPFKETPDTDLQIESLARLAKN